jgi:Helix-turn-helix domain
MDRARVHEKVRHMRFEGLLKRLERGELSQGEAAEMLGMGERTFRRWRDRFRDEGPSGLADRRLGKPSARRAKAAKIARMLELYSGPAMTGAPTWWWHSRMRPAPSTRPSSSMKRGRPRVFAGSAKNWPGGAAEPQSDPWHCASRHVARLLLHFGSYSIDQ